MKPAIQFLLLGLIQLPVILLGLPLVAVGLPFRRVETNPEGRKIIRLPKWLLPWDNVIDGLTGDKRNYYSSYTIDWPWWFAMWWWAAIRNPANYFKRFILACDISRCRTQLLKGAPYVRDDLNSTGYQLLAAHSSSFTYYHFYLVRRWFNTNRALVIQFGFKFRLGQEYEVLDPGQDYKRYKGFTIEIAPFKDIG